jgi:hypothetical protein
MDVNPLDDTEEQPEAQDIEKDIQELTGRVEKTLNKIDKEFGKCPQCGLPTHTSSDGSTAFCARCNAYYNVQEEKGGKRLVGKDRSVNRKRMLIIAFSGIAAILLVFSLGLFWFLSESDPGYIDIDDVNKIRGLPESKNVPKDQISREELDEMLREPLGPEERRDLWEYERFLECLFIIPESWDLVDIVENESSGAGIAGFYDTEEEKMYVVGDFHTSNYVNYILSHEYTHALQDQNFDLDSYMDTGHFDTEFARLCVIEGDAVLTMDKWAEKNLDDYEEVLVQIESIAQLLSTIDYDGSYYNEVLGEMTYFPYEGGLEFVQEIYDEGGYEAVNELFTTKPPLSSEHILHPHKYRSYEPPMEIEVDIGDIDYDLVFTSTVGEKLLSEMLYYNLGWSGDPKGYGYGWGGDVFEYYESGEDFLAVLSTRWDTVGDNTRFGGDIGSMISWMSMSEENGIYSMDEGWVYLESKGDSTTMYYSSSFEAVTHFRE